jgi:hypothetical protein
MSKSSESHPGAAANRSKRLLHRYTLTRYRIVIKRVFGHRTASYYFVADVVLFPDHPATDIVTTTGAWTAPVLRGLGWDEANPGGAGVVPGSWPWALGLGGRALLTIDYNDYRITSATPPGTADQVATSSSAD